jgi:hypothetical protein
MTAAEVRRRHTPLDIARWRAWEEENGPMLLHERIDAAAQLIAYNVHAAGGGKEAPERFRINWRSRALTPDQQVSWLRALAARSVN